MSQVSTSEVCPGSRADRYVKVPLRVQTVYSVKAISIEVYEPYGTRFRVKPHGPFVAPTVVRLRVASNATQAVKYTVRLVSDDAIHLNQAAIIVPEHRIFWRKLKE